MLRVLVGRAIVRRPTGRMSPFRAGVPLSRSYRTTRTTRDSTEMEFHELTDSLLTDFRSQPLDSDQLQQASSCIQYWTRQRTPLGVKNSLSLFDSIIATIENDEEQQARGHWFQGNHPRSSHLLYAILDSWRITGSAHINPREMHRVVQKWMDRGVPVDARLFTILLTAEVDKNPHEAPIWGQELVNQLLDLSIETDTVLWTAILMAWSKSRRSDRVGGAFKLWKDWHDLLKDRAISCQPSLQSFNTVLEILASAGEMERADIFLENMQRHVGVLPDSDSYRLVIFGWVDAALQNPQRHTASDREDLPNPNPLRRAYRLLRDMVELSSGGHDRVRPDSAFFSKLISASARLEQIGLSEEIYRDLQEMQEGSVDYTPDAFTKRSLLILMTKTGRPEEAQRLLDEMEKEGTKSSQNFPKPSHYRDVLLSWVEAGNPDKAEHILLRLFHIAKELENQGSIDKWLPNKDLVRHVMVSWASRRGTSDAGFRAEILLRKMQDLSRESDLGSLSYCPNMYQHVMMAWARTKSKEAAEQAELLMFEITRSATPLNRFHYFALLVAWSKVRGKKGVESLVFWFDDAVSAYQYGKVDSLPDQAMYGAMIQGLMNNGEGELAEKYWDLMLDNFQNIPNAARPTIKIMNMVMTAWERSGKSKAGERAIKFIERTESWSRASNGDLHPDRRTLETAIRIVSSGPDRCSRTVSSLEHQLERLPQL